MSRIAPRTEASASSLCGGTLPAVSGGTATATVPAQPCGVTMVLISAVTPSTTSTVTMWVPVLRIGSVSSTRRLSSLHPARLPDRVRDLLGGDGAEQAAVVTGLVGDREHGLPQQGGRLLRLGLGLRLGPLGRLATPLRLRDGGRRGGLGELARDEVVPQVPGETSITAPLSPRVSTSCSRMAWAMAYRIARRTATDRAPAHA